MLPFSPLLSWLPEMQLERELLRHPSLDEVAPALLGRGAVREVAEREVEVGVNRADRAEHARGLGRAGVVAGRGEMHRRLIATSAIEACSPPNVRSDAAASVTLATRQLTSRISCSAPRLKAQSRAGWNAFGSRPPNRGYDAQRSPVGDVGSARKSAICRMRTMRACQVRLRCGEARKKGSHTHDQSGPYRARTDDIHGVNVALYQLS